MITPQLTTILMYTMPSLKHLIATYKTRVNHIIGFQYNTKGIPCEIIADYLIKSLATLDALKLLDSCLSVALTFLTPEEREIVELLYFKDLSLVASAKKLGIKTSTLRYRRQRVIERLGTIINLLGFSTERILENFNDIELFIESAKRSKETHGKSRAN